MPPRQYDGCPCCGSRPGTSHADKCSLINYIQQPDVAPHIRDIAVEATLRHRARGFSNEPDTNTDVDMARAGIAQKTMSAPDLLDAAAGHMSDRAATYDQPGGERSMGRTVAAFNIITGREGERALSESEGWLLMQTLKDVRDRQRAKPHRDSVEDKIAYAALGGEARLAEGGMI